MARQQDNAFYWPVRVYYEDTDVGGVVYYANYLKFMERARTEYLRQLGFEQDELIADAGILFAVREAHVEYHLPARFNDALSVSARVNWVRRASLEFEQEITPADAQTRLCSARVRLACLRADDLKPAPIPDTIKELLTP